MTIIETATAPQAQQRTSALLDVKDLRVTFKTPTVMLLPLTISTSTCVPVKRWALWANPVPVNPRPHSR